MSSVTSPRKSVDNDSNGEKARQSGDSSEEAATSTLHDEPQHGRQARLRMIPTASTTTSTTITNEAQEEEKVDSVEQNLSLVFPLEEQTRQGITFDSMPATFTPTREGNKALTKGREIYRSHGQREIFGIDQPIAQEIRENGGKDLLLTWFGMFYLRMFQDPRMAVLFDTRHEDTNVSAAEHGRRLVLGLLSRWTGDATYSRERRNGLFYNLMVSHNRAKKCPLRHASSLSSSSSSSQGGGGFTVDQRDSWLGHLWLAGETAEVPLDFRNHVVSSLASVIVLYGPFVEAPLEKR